MVLTLLQPIQTHWDHNKMHNVKGQVQCYFIWKWNGTWREKKTTSIDRSYCRKDVLFSVNNVLRLRWTGQTYWADIQKTKYGNSWAFKKSEIVNFSIFEIPFSLVIRSSVGIRWALQWAVAWSWIARFDWVFQFNVFCFVEIGILRWNSSFFHHLRFW